MAVQLMRCMAEWFHALRQSQMIQRLGDLLNCLHLRTQVLAVTSITVPSEYAELGGDTTVGWTCSDLVPMTLCP